MYDCWHVNPLLLLICKSCCQCTPIAGLKIEALVNNETYQWCQIANPNELRHQKAILNLCWPRASRRTFSSLSWKCWNSNFTFTLISPWICARWPQDCSRDKSLWQMLWLLHRKHLVKNILDCTVFNYKEIYPNARRYEVRGREGTWQNPQ